MPVDTLQLQIGVVLLKREVESFVEVNVGSLHDVSLVIVGNFELVLVEVLGENFHYL